MAERDAGQRLDGEFGHRRLLLFGEIAHLRLREGDVGQILVGELRHAGTDLGLGQAEIRTVPIVELAAEIPHGVVAARLEGENHFFYRVRVVTPGKFVVPPTYAEDMYQPMIYGLAGGGDTLVVEGGEK